MILNVAEKRKHTGINLIGFQKAFDTLVHKLLSDKMKCIGFSDKRNKMVSLLSHR